MLGTYTVPQVTTVGLGMSWQETGPFYLFAKQFCFGFKVMGATEMAEALLHLLLKVA